MKSASCVAIALALGACTAQPSSRAGARHKGAALPADAYWPMYRHDVLGTADSGDPLTLADAATLAPLWTFSAHYSNYANPVVVGSTVYIASGDGQLYAVDTATGQLKWSATEAAPTFYNCDGTQNEGGKGPIGAPAVVGNTLFIPSGSGAVDARDKDTGALLWSTVIADPTVNEFLFSSALPVNGRVYLGVASIQDCRMVPGRLVALDQGTGAVTGTWWGDANHLPGATVWTTPVYDAATHRIFVTTGTIDKGRTKDSQPLAQAFVAIDPDTLETIDWYSPVDTDFDADEEFGGSPLIFDTLGGRQLIGAAAKTGWFYAVDRNNLGAGLVWRTQIALNGVEPDLGETTIVSAAWANNTIFAGGGKTPDGFSGSVVALDPETGTPLWTFHPKGFVLPALTIAGETVLAPATDWSTHKGTLYALDQATGTPVFTFDAPIGMFGEATFAGGAIYIGDLQGGLTALTPALR